MAHHFRSQSEQYQPQLSQQLQTIESFIRVHTDSQQSLDRLFNPPASSIPLRSRNLPRSFFNPSVKLEDCSTPTNNGASTNQFHTRSVSYEQPQPRLLTRRANNFHVRTHSTLAPMPDYDSGQSSLDCLNTSSTTLDTATTDVYGQGLISPTTDSGSPMPHQQSAISADWSSPVTSIEDISGLPNTGLHFEQLTSAPAPPLPPPHSHGAGLDPSGNPVPSVQPPSQGPMSTHQPAVSMGVPVAHDHNQQQATNNFYDQTQAAIVTNTTANCNNTYANNLHTRSMSFDQHRSTGSVHISNQNNFHIRTHSTLAPMAGNLSTTPTAAGRPPYQTSREFLNYANNNHSATGWSSSGYSSDDMTAVSNNFWLPRPQMSTPQQCHIPPIAGQQRHQQQAIPMAQQPADAVNGGSSITANMVSQTAPTQQPFRSQESQVFYDI